MGRQGIKDISIPRACNQPLEKEKKVNESDVRKHRKAVRLMYLGNGNSDIQVTHVSCAKKKCGGRGQSNQKATL